MATVKKRKEKKSIYEGNVYIQATFNNTIITITDLKGNVLSWASSRRLRLCRCQKIDTLCGSNRCGNSCTSASPYGLHEVHVFVKGPGVGRESAIRTLGTMGLKVRSISDVTPIPHNGCRPKKTRRI